MPLFGFTKKEGEEVKEKIANDINPGEASGLKHNKGKPKKAPYSTQESSTARFLTNCAGEHKASLKCIEENYSNRAACQPFFDTYKECRAEENEKRKASNSGFGVTSVGSSRTFSLRVRTPLCSAENDSIAEGAASPLRLISFDLDDTLFPTTEVVRAANKKMLDALKERGCGEVALPDYLTTTKTIRRGLDSPITYQGLRKMAIKQTFLNAGIENDDKLDARVNDCYQAWEDERHAAAQRFLYEDAIETLQTLQATYPDAAIVAITNGAGDPLQMKETLAPYFDFTISGEMEAVFPHRKPHNFIYEYTLQQYQEKTGAIEESSALTLGGWVHVGDCLANDVGASTRCGAQAIWFCHLEEYEMGGTGDEVQMAASRLMQSKDTAQTPEWSTATPEEVAARKKQIEDGKQYVAATIHSLSELPDAVQSVLATKPPSLQEI